AAIADTVERIPVPDRAEHASQVEVTLLEQARTVDPRTVMLLGQRILAHLDPDGPSPEEQRLQQSHRRVDLDRLPDSTGCWAGGSPRPVRRSGRRSSPRWPLADPTTLWVRTSAPRDSGCMTRSKKPVADCSRLVSCPIMPA